MGSLFAEVDRLVTLAQRISMSSGIHADVTRRNIQAAVRALLQAMDRYRAHIVPGEDAPKEQRAVIEKTEERARRSLIGAESERALDFIVGLALSGQASAFIA